MCVVWSGVYLCEIFSLFYSNQLLFCAWNSCTRM